MKRPSLLQNIGWAISLTAIAAIFGFVLNMIFNELYVKKLIIVIVTLVYLFKLVNYSQISIGKLTLLLSSWIVLASSFYLFEQPVTLLMTAIGLIWVIRSLLCYSSGLSAVADLGVCVMSLGAGIMAFTSSGSIAVAIWSLFLIQALHSLIPVRFEEAFQKAADTTPVQRFDRAYHLAEEAVRQILKSDL